MPVGDICWSKKINYYGKLKKERSKSVFENITFVRNNEYDVIVSDSEIRLG